MIHIKILKLPTSTKKYASYLQKIIALCNCKYCFKIRIIHIIIVYTARVKLKASVHVNGNSIRNTFTECIHEMYIVLV